MNEIQIFVKPMVNMNNNGYNYCQTFVMTVNDNELIDNLRRDIYNKCRHIAPNRMILRFNNKILQSGSHLNEYYGLNNNATIYVLYNERSDWFNKERDIIENGIIKLNENIDSLKTEQLKIDELTINLKKDIKSAPSLKELNECKIEDESDVNMNKLNAMIISFENKIENGSLKRNIEHSMKSLNILINNALTSINHEEQMKCSQIDKKIKNIQYQIKMLENELNGLQTEKAEIQSKNDKYRTDLNEINMTYIINNKYKIKTMINNINIGFIINNLKETKTKKFKELELENQEWDNQNLLIWIKNINNGYFNKPNNEKYKLFFNNLYKQQIDGSNINELSSNICLNLLGLTDETDQNILIQNVNNLLRMNMNNDFIVKGNRCCACLSKCIQCVLCPCGHQPYCYECANKSRKHDNRCPICRTRINNVMKTFISGV